MLSMSIYWSMFFLLLSGIHFLSLNIFYLGAEVTVQLWWGVLGGLRAASIFSCNQGSRRSVGVSFVCCLLPSYIYCPPCFGPEHFLCASILVSMWIWAIHSDFIFEIFNRTVGVSTEQTFRKSYDLPILVIACYAYVNLLKSSNPWCFQRNSCIHFSGFLLVYAVFTSCLDVRTNLQEYDVSEHFRWVYGVCLFLSVKPLKLSCISTCLCQVCPRDTEAG